MGWKKQNLESERVKVCYFWKFESRYLDRMKHSIHDQTSASSSPSVCKNCSLSIHSIERTVCILTFFLETSTVFWLIWCSGGYMPALLTFLHQTHQRPSVEPIILTYQDIWLESVSGFRTDEPTPRTRWSIRFAVFVLLILMKYNILLRALWYLVPS